MAKFVFLFAVFFILQISQGARVVREEPAEQPSVFEEVSKQASTFLTDLGTTFNELTGAKDTTEVQNILKTNTDNFISKATDIAKGLQEQFATASGDTKTVLGQAISKINQTISDLKEKHPEATAKVEDFNTNLKKGLETLLSEADKIGKTVVENSKGVQDDISKITKKAYDQVVETSKTVQQQLHEYANKPAN